MNTILPICKFTIDFRALKALSILASKDAARYTLNGVSVEIKGGEKIVVATDGLRLGAMRFLSTDGDTPTEGSLIIPADLIKRIPKPKISTEVTVECDGERIAITSDYDSITGNGINGHYPAWRQVIPSSGTTPVRRMVFNPDLMAGFFAVYKALGGAGMTLEQTTPPSQKMDGQTPFCLRINNIPQFFGILMPLYCDSMDSPMIPTWLKDSKEAANG